MSARADPRLSPQELAAILAAQCAVAPQRVRMTHALIEGEKMRHDLEVARVVRMSTMPAVMPLLRGYDLCGTFLPASLTAGDTLDPSLLGQGLLIVIGDATGHGSAPALSVTQRHAMLRMALRMGADPQTAVMLVNDQLAAKLDDDRFITAFIGLLGGTTHRMRLRSAGRAPILHFQAAAGACVRGNRTSSPLAAMAVSALRPAARLEFMPGDILDLLSDAIYEYHDAGREQFWPERVEAILRTHHFRRMAELSATLLDAVRAVARRAAQDDDITLVLVKREAPA